MTPTLTRNAAREGALPGTKRAVVVLGGDDVYEDLTGVADAVAQLLAEAGFATRSRMGTAALLHLADAELVVLDTAVPELTLERVEALAEAVRAGTGLLVMHASAVAPEGDAGRRLAALVGARFASHGPRPHESRFTVETDPAHPITDGIGTFDLDHEHYLLETSADATPIAWRRTDDGREPLALVRTEGAGRVCYLQLGHDTRPIAEPPVRQLLIRAAVWRTRPGKEG